MFEHRLAKKWKVVEVQLTQAEEFLLEPERFQQEEKDLAEYREYLHVNEKKLPMSAGPNQVSGSSLRQQQKQWS